MNGEGEPPKRGGKGKGLLYGRTGMGRAEDVVVKVREFVDICCTHPTKPGQNARRNHQISQKLTPQLSSLRMGNGIRLGSTENPALVKGNSDSKWEHIRIDSNY